MAIFALAFGSFGDFVTVIQLAAKLRKAFYAASGSPQPTQIRELIADFNVFTRALEHLRATVDRRRTELPPDVLNGIEHALGVCRDVLQAVERRLRAERGRITSAKGRAFWQQLWAAAAWSILGGDAEVEALRTRLRENVNLMQTLLAVSQCHDQDALRETLHQQHVTVDRILGLVEAIPLAVGVGTPSFQFRDQLTGEFYQPCLRISVQHFEDLRATWLKFQGKPTHVDEDFGQLQSYLADESVTKCFQREIRYRGCGGLGLDCFFFRSDFNLWQVLVAESPYALTMENTRRRLSDTHRKTYQNIIRGPMQQVRYRSISWKSDVSLPLAILVLEFLVDIPWQFACQRDAR